MLLWTDLRASVHYFSAVFFTNRTVLDQLKYENCPQRVQFLLNGGGGKWWGRSVSFHLPVWDILSSKTEFQFLFHSQFSMSVQQEEWELLLNDLLAGYSKFWTFCVLASFNSLCGSDSVTTFGFCFGPVWLFAATYTAAVLLKIVGHK